MTTLGSFLFFNEGGLVRRRHSIVTFGMGDRRRGLDPATGCLRLGSRTCGWQAAF